MTVEEARTGVGRRVIYQPPGQGRAAREAGEIVEVRDVTGYDEGGYVMVRYDGDEHAKATAPSMLTFAGEQR